MDIEEENIINNFSHLYQKKNRICIHKKKMILKQEKKELRINDHIEITFLKKKC